MPEVLCWAALAAYLAAGAALSIELTVRMRRYHLARHITWQPDREDMIVMALGGLLWPLALVVFGWHKAYTWRKLQVERKDRLRDLSA